MPRHGSALLLLFLRQLRLSTCRLLPSWLSVRGLCTLRVLPCSSRVSPSALLVFSSVYLAVHLGGLGLGCLLRVCTLSLLIPLHMGGEVLQVFPVGDFPVGVFPVGVSPVAGSEKIRVASKRLTRLVGEGIFTRSVFPTNPVGFKLSARAEGGKARSAPGLLSRQSRGGKARRSLTSLTILVTSTRQCRGGKARLQLTSLIIAATISSTYRSRGGKARRHPVSFNFGSIGNISGTYPS